MSAGKAAVVAALRVLADSRKAAAEELATYAANLAEMDDEKFEQIMGAEYGGPGYVTQMHEAVEAAAHSRPGELWAVNKALADALADAQRKGAAQ